MWADMYGITSRLKSLMPASLLMRLTSQRKSAHMSLRTRSVSPSIGGGLSVTRTTFLEPRLNMFTLTLTTLSTACCSQSSAGRNLRSRM